ncbi:MAG: PaaI family thioesterase [Parvibaculum sp.]|nr:PaaI family thioesterase [Parvibaculum sp.]
MSAEAIPGLLPGGETPFERVSRVLTEQPFSMLVGAKVGKVERGRAALTVENRPDLTQNNGYIHGGVIGYLADNASGCAASTMLPEGAVSLVTSEYKLNLLRPATGRRAIARGEVVKAGRRQCVVETRVVCTDEAGKETLVAIALATLAYIYPADL